MGPHVFSGMIQTFMCSCACWLVIRVFILSVVCMTSIHFNNQHHNLKYQMKITSNIGTSWWHKPINLNYITLSSSSITCYDVFTLFALICSVCLFRHSCTCWHAYVCCSLGCSFVCFFVWTTSTAESLKSELFKPCLIPYFLAFNIKNGIPQCWN